jgi:hypothetical protein
MQEHEAKGCPKCGYQNVLPADRISYRLAWRHNWLECIFEFASVHLQTMSWVEGRGANWVDGEVWVSDFTCCYSEYFTGLAMIGNESGILIDGVLSSEELEACSGLTEAADNFWSFYDGNKFWSFFVGNKLTAEEIIQHPKWQVVIGEAARLWNHLKTVSTDSADVKTIESLERRFGVVPSFRGNAHNIATDT